MQVANLKKPYTRICKKCKEEFETLKELERVCEHCKVRIPKPKCSRKRKVVKVVVEK